MSNAFNTQRLVVLTLSGTAMLLASCSLPPQQAWRKIQNEGLAAYMSYEMNSQHRYAHLKKSEGLPDPAKPAIAPTTPKPAPVLTLSSPSGTTTPVQPLKEPALNVVSDGKVLAAIAVPSLPGFVRSPYTNPPRLVDVKGAPIGSTMVCPYTQRPFIVPNELTPSTPKTLMATNTAPAPAPKVTPEPSVAPSQPKIVASPTPAPEPKPSAPAAVTPVTPAPAKTMASTTPVQPAPLPAPSPVVTPAPEPKPVVADIPFGSAIAGRPGFVNSPFAAKHQLVDVTGLPTGMEVKCPYTGKLFRVPNQDVATVKPAATPPVASPEKK
jgi:hypothetical protein